MKPLISIIIPAYNEEKNIARCLNALLALDHPNSMTEVIVVDNNSIDNTSEIIRKYPVRCFREEKKSSYAARNRGIEQARGDWVAFTDADCVADKDWLNELVKGFDSEKVAGCGGKILGYPSENLIERYPGQDKVLSQEGALKKDKFSPPFLLTANAIYRKDALKEVGYFDPTFIGGGDADLAWRIQSLGYELKYIPQAIIWHKHRDNLKDLWRQRIRHGEGYVSLFKKYRKKWGRRFWVRWRDWLALGYFLIKFFFCFIFNLDKKRYAFYDLFCRTGLIVGKIRSSFRHKILVL